MLKSPAIAYLSPRPLNNQLVDVRAILRPQAWVLEGLPEVTAHYDPPRHRQHMARIQALRERLRPLLGDQVARGVTLGADQQGPASWIDLSGHRRMSERQAERYLERWVWHHREWATRGDGQPVHCPYHGMKRLSRPLEVEREKARRWDALQARKRRQREAKAKLNVPAGAQP